MSKILLMDFHEIWGWIYPSTTCSFSSTSLLYHSYTVLGQVRKIEQLGIMGVGFYTLDALSVAKQTVSEQ